VQPSATSRARHADLANCGLVARLAQPTSVWASPWCAAPIRGQSSATARPGTATACKARVLAWSPASDGFLAGEHKSTAIVLGSTSNGAARSQALARTEEERRHGEAAQQRQDSVAVVVVGEKVRAGSGVDLHDREGARISPQHANGVGARPAQ
jgi:hypothetical protein